MAERESDKAKSRRPWRLGTRVFVGGGLGVIVIFTGLQLVPVKRSNPPTSSPLTASHQVESALRKACYDCHSNETQWPWYSYVAPASWLVTGHVKEGREHLNFSTWGEYGPDQQRKLRHESWEELAEGEMPLPGYIMLHQEANLSGRERDLIRAWASEAGTRANQGEDEDHDADHDD